MNKIKKKNAKIRTGINNSGWRIGKYRIYYFTLYFFISCPFSEILMNI